MYSVTILGAGNVATHISRHLYLQGYRIDHVWSKSQEHAELLSDELGALAIWGDQPVPEGSDLYIMSLTDEAISSVASLHSGFKGIWLHTAGAVGMDVLAGHFSSYGVIYPLQSFSREIEVNFRKIPLLLEASSPDVMLQLREMAGSLSDVLREVDSSRRLAIHLAGVFANNFANHMIHLASKIMEEAGEDFSLLVPILECGLEKILSIGPADAQTGPARRGDMHTMKKHLERLKGHPEWEKLYTFVSRSIQDEQF